MKRAEAKASQPPSWIILVRGVRTNEDTGARGTHKLGGAHLSVVIEESGMKKGMASPMVKVQEDSPGGHLLEHTSWS